MRPRGNLGRMGKTVNQGQTGQLWETEKLDRGLAPRKVIGGTAERKEAIEIRSGRSLYGRAGKGKEGGFRCSGGTPPRREIETGAGRKERQPSSKVTSY